MHVDILQKLDFDETAMNDHLSWATLFYMQKVWSLIAGCTVLYFPAYSVTPYT